ncbi:MAG: hypothetical protein L6290_12390, partial [Thermodesulfovibrionales bacterium]|nr:hypothetical protein [Thermodesulfovibrionales bacterium]
LNILFISILLYNIGFFAWTLDALYSVLIGISLSVINRYKYYGNTDKPERELIKRDGHQPNLHNNPRP